MPIFDFNTPATVGALGAAVSEINQQVLRQIGVTIQNYETRAYSRKGALHMENSLTYTRNGDYLIPDLSLRRTAGEAPGQVRQDAEGVPESCTGPCSTTSCC